MVDDPGTAEVEILLEEPGNRRFTRLLDDHLIFISWQENRTATNAADMVNQRIAPWWDGNGNSYEAFSKEGSLISVWEDRQGPYSHFMRESSTGSWQPTFEYLDPEWTIFAINEGTALVQRGDPPQYGAATAGGAEVTLLDLPLVAQSFWNDPSAVGLATFGVSDGKIVYVERVEMDGAMGSQLVMMEPPGFQPAVIWRSPDEFLHRVVFHEEQYFGTFGKYGEMNWRLLVAPNQTDGFPPVEGNTFELFYGPAGQGGFYALHGYPGQYHVSRLSNGGVEPIFFTDQSEILSIIEATPESVYLRTRPLSSTDEPVSSASMENQEKTRIAQISS